MVPKTPEATAEIERLEVANAQLQEQLEVCHHICGTFFEALKPLNLTHINVANPGAHVTELLQTASVNADLADKWRRFTSALGGHPAAVNPEDAAKRLKALGTTEE